MKKIRLKIPKIIDFIQNFLEKRVEISKKKERRTWFVRQVLYEKINKSLSNEKILERLNEKSFNENDISELVKRLILNLQ